MSESLAKRADRLRRQCQCGHCVQWRKEFQAMQDAQHELAKKASDLRVAWATRQRKDLKCEYYD